MPSPQFHALLAALVAALLTILSGCSSKNESPTAASATSAPLAAASATASGVQRSALKTQFVLMFEKECLPRIPAEASLSQTQKTNFCQCYAAAMADNNNEKQLMRYLAGQDQEQILRDADNYGKPCLAQARLQP